MTPLGTENIDNEDGDVRIGGAISFVGQRIETRKEADRFDREIMAAEDQRRGCQDWGAISFVGQRIETRKEAHRFDREIMAAEDQRL